MAPNRPFIAASFCFAIACGSSRSEGDNTPSSGGSAGAGTGGAAAGTAGAGTGGAATGGQSGSGGSSGGFADCEAFCASYVEQCAVEESCWAVCTAVHEPACEREFAAYYSCLLAAPPPTFDCSQSIFAHEEPLCEDEDRASGLCMATGGEDCVFVPDLDEPVCAVAMVGGPRAAVCKVDVTPPAGCVRFGAGYCCP